MTNLHDEIRRFRAARTECIDNAAQTAAVFLTARIDLVSVLAAPDEERARAEAKLERLMERERLRGMRRHWSYDLNRHIALKQALERIRAARR